MPETERPEEQKGFAKWIKRFGVAGFLFFFFKGLLFYIILPTMLIWFGVSC